MWPGDGVPLVGMGCMRLSTDPARNEERGIAVLHAAFDAGVTLLDTADAYCHDEHDVGHNERLIARALASWGGDRTDRAGADRARIRVATKMPTNSSRQLATTDGGAMSVMTRPPAFPSR